MSFILDALKKSENERQRQIGPSLADAPVRRRQADRPWWAFAVAALLIVNLGVLVVVLVRNSGNADVRPVEVPAPATIPAAPAPQPRPAAVPTPHAIQTPPIESPNAALRNPNASLATEAATGQGTEQPTLDHLAAAANVPAGPPMVRPIDSPTVAPLTARAPADTSSNNEMLPTHNSLVGGGTSLPDLRLDIHVYSANPAERFVLVNMRKYTEGQSLSEGPAVERITADGVILNQQGLRFLLPRQ